MIVPANRLLLCVALLIIPLALLGAMDPQLSAVAIAATSVFSLVALADALMAVKSRGGITIQLPPIARMSQDRSSHIDVKIRSRGQRNRALCLALPLPREIKSPQEEMHIRVSKDLQNAGASPVPHGSDSRAVKTDTEWSHVVWPCIPQERGAYRISTAYVETASPLGLWLGRASHPVNSEIRVYPNLSDDRRHLAALFLNRGAFGLHAQRQVGKGREFEKLREYIPGDGFDEIHWKATARRGRPITKVFQIEKTQEIYVILDSSRLSARKVMRRDYADPDERQNAAPHLRTPGREGPVLRAEDPHRGASSALPASRAATTLERYITAALVLGLVAEQQGDLFGLLTFSDRIDGFRRAYNGKSHYNACRDALYTLQPKIVSPDFDELSTFIRLRLRRRALLVFLTSLDDPVLAQSFVRNLDLICRQHLILVNMIQPPGVVPVFTSQAVYSVHDLYGHLAGHLQWQKLRALDKTLQRRGVEFSLLNNEKLSADLVSQYLRVKKRQLL